MGRFDGRFDGTCRSDAMGSSTYKVIVTGNGMDDSQARAPQPITSFGQRQDWWSLPGFIGETRGRVAASTSRQVKTPLTT